MSHETERGDTHNPEKPRSTLGPETPSISHFPAELPLSPPVPCIPGYEILSVLGQGGMGIVYKARHLHLDRIVALKVLGTNSHPDQGRFRTEVEAVARLQHPNIVQIFDVGIWAGTDGRPPLPYFTMEFCAGESLDSRLAGTPLADHDAAALVETLARAMQAAHDAKIIHRDLKPANVLLMQEDLTQRRKGAKNADESKDERQVASDSSSFAPLRLCVRSSSLTPKITDFGLAKKLDEIGQTQTGEVMGTPPYMAPEQALGIKDIGTAADVYALGAILYECLTGRPPFKAATVFDTLSQVIADEPAPPRRLNPNVDRDLETISLKCLEKDPARRPPSAAALADELRRFLDGKPILSRPVGALSRLWRWGKRNPVVAAVSGLAGFALLCVLLLSIAFALRERGHSETLRQALNDARYQVAENYLDRALVPAAQTEPDDRLLWLARSLNAVPEGAIDLETVIRYNLAAWRRALHELRAPLPHEDAIRCLAFSPDGRLLLTGCADRTTHLWDTRTGERIDRAMTHDGSILAVAFDDRGRALAAIPGEKSIRIVDARSGKTVAGPFVHKDAVGAVTWSQDGKLLATGSSDDTARVWDLAAGTAKTAPLPHDTAVIAVALSPDGKQVLTGTFGGLAQLWEVGSGKAHDDALLHPKMVSAVAFAPHGKTIVTGCADNTARIWDVRTGKLLGNPIRHRPADGTVWSVAVSANGERLLTGGDDGTARMWDLATGNPVGQSLAHQDGILAVAFSPDGWLAATAGYDKTVRLWETAPRAFLGPMNHKDGVLTGAISPDGALIATTSADGSARLWSTATGRPAGTPLMHKGSVTGVAFSPDGRMLVTASADGTAQVWRVGNGQALGPALRHAGSVSDAAFSPDGKLVATASADRTAALWDVGTGNRRTVLAHEGEVFSVIFHPRGNVLLTACADGNARIWEVPTGRLQATLSHEDRVWNIAFRPDGKKAVTSSDDRTARLWWVDDPNREPIVLRHLQVVRTVAFSDDSKWVATGSHDHTARVWNGDTGEPGTRPLAHQRPVLSVAFHPIGRLLATGSADRTARLWDTRLGRAVGPLLEHQGSVSLVAFDPTGKSVLTCCKDATARLWPVPLPMEGDAKKILRWTERVTGKTLDTAGAMHFLDVPAWQERRREAEDTNEP